jgi:hypothetical protein
MPPRDRRNSSTSSPPSAEVVPSSTLPGGDDTGRTLPYDQVPTERRTIGDATGRLDGHLGVLGVALAQWMARDDTRPQPEVRRAASTAIDAIDAILASLHELRARLVGEIASDGELLAWLVGGNPGRLP